MAVNIHQFTDQLYIFTGLAHTAAKFKNMYCEIIFDPELIPAVKTSPILEEMLERYLRKELSSVGCV